MKLKKQLRTLLPVILLLLLITQRSYAQTPPESQNSQSSGYGIELNQFYPGILVLELMQAAEEEIDIAVNEAYAQGYKAAMLRYMPELAAKNEENLILRSGFEAARGERRHSLRNMFITGGLSFLGGLVTGLLIPAGR